MTKQEQDKNKENPIAASGDEDELQSPRHLRHLLSLCHTPGPEQMPDYEQEEDDEEDDEEMVTWSQLPNS